MQKLKFTFFIQFWFMACGLLFTQGSFAQVYFENSKSVVLRNSNMQAKAQIPVGSKISIDPTYLKKILGSETPTEEKMIELMLNPTGVSNKISTENFVNSAGEPLSDYFFPVEVTEPSGRKLKGKMAIQSLNRLGAAQMKFSETQDIQKTVSQEVVDRLILQKEEAKKIPNTEAGFCVHCQLKENSTIFPKLLLTPKSGVAGSPIKDLNFSQSINPLYEKYKKYASEFVAANKKIHKGNSGEMKKRFVKGLVEKFGAAEAGQILKVLTAFGETPHRKLSFAQSAEIAGIMKVIENRTKNNFRTKSRFLNQLGIGSDADARLSVILANWQFSTWNDGDNNLVSILRFDPEKADALTQRRMNIAFETQRKLDQNEIQFLGDMNKDNIHHYHANYVVPNWSRASQKVRKGLVEIIQKDESGVNQSVYVDLNQQSGNRHIFYAGIP